jgi:hypothetical protein
MQRLGEAVSHLTISRSTISALATNAHLREGEGESR